MPCEHDALPDWLHDEGLGEATLLMACRPTLTLSIRPYGIEGGVTREESIREVAPVATVETLREALRSFRLKQILTPAFCETGVWQPKRAGSHVPGPQPERAIQQGLGRWLNSWFRGVLHARPEESTNIGRIDITLIVEEGARLVHWAILGLKVIKSFANATGKAKPATVSRAVNVDAIIKGLEEAHAYGIKITSMSFVVGIAAFAATVPSAASAQSAYGYGQHDQRHDRLEDRHDDNHEELDEVHADAHDQGLSRRGHRQLHRELQYEHAESDYQLARQHQRQDRRALQRRYYNPNYNRYYGH